MFTFSVFLPKSGFLDIMSSEGCNRHRKLFIVSIAAEVVGVYTALTEAMGSRITLQYLQPSSSIEDANHRKVKASKALSIL